MGQRDSYPGGGAYPTSIWIPGQMVRDTFEVPITATARGPAPAWVSAGLYRLSTKEKLPAKDAHGSPVIFPLLAKISLDSSAPTLVPAHGLTANLENRVRLLGYDLPQPTVKPGSNLEITLFWQDTAKLDRDYSAFVHLVGEGDGIAAQDDGLPLQGFYKTSAWQPGEILNDTRKLTLPKNLRPGVYRLYAGLYDAAGGQRLSVLDEQGGQAGNQIAVADITVQ